MNEKEEFEYLKTLDKKTRIYYLIDKYEELKSLVAIFAEDVTFGSSGMKTEFKLKRLMLDTMIKYLRRSL